MPESSEVPFKLGRHEPGVGVSEHRYDNVYQRIPTGLLVAPEKGQVHLFLRLLQHLPGPFRLTYVLLVPFGPYAEGRYELQEVLDHEALELLLDRNRDFLERDARHHLVVGTIPPNISVRYDQHDYLRVDGPFPNLEGMLGEMGFTEGEIAMPIPHSHHHHPQFDADAEALLGTGHWIRSPLTEED